MYYFEFVPRVITFKVRHGELFNVQFLKLYQTKKQSVLSAKNHRVFR